MEKKNIIIAVAVAALGILYLTQGSNNPVAAGPAQTDAAKLGEEVSVATVAAFKGKEGVVVLDVREPNEYAAGHIPGVLHIPMGQAVARKAEYIKNKIVFVTCRSGNRSGQVTRMLRAQGHANVHNMAGGIGAWQSAGQPVE